MAIVHTRKVQRIEVYPMLEGEKPSLMVTYIYTFDDTEDAELPVNTKKAVRINAITDSEDENGDVIETPTDVSSHDPLVQTICNAVWAE